MGHKYPWDMQIGSSHRIKKEGIYVFFLLTSLKCPSGPLTPPFDAAASPFSTWLPLWRRPLFLTNENTPRGVVVCARAALPMTWHHYYVMCHLACVSHLRKRALNFHFTIHANLQFLVSFSFETQTKHLDSHCDRLNTYVLAYFSFYLGITWKR